MELVLYFAILYVIIGILTTVIACYMSDSIISAEELVVTLFLWPMIIYIEYRDYGWREIIKSGFIDDKKGYFTRLLIMFLCLVILFSIVTLLDNVI